MTHLARDELVASANGLGPPPPSPGADAGHSFLSLEDGPLSSPMSSHPSGSGSGSGYNTQSSPTRGDPSHPFGSPTDSYSSSARSLSPPSNRERIAEGLQSFADFGNRSEWDSEEKEPAEQVEREDRRLFRGKDRNTRGSRLGAQLANPKTHPFASTAGLSSPPIGQGPNGKRRGSSPLDARRGQDRQTAAELDESEEMNTTAEFGKSRLWGARAGSVGSRVAERGMLFRAEDQGPGSRNEGKTETVGRSGGKPSLKLGSAFGLNPSADQGSFAQSGPSSLARNSQGGQSSGYDFGEGSLESAISPDRESGSSIGTATTVNGSMGGTTGTGHTSISARSAAFGGSSKLPPSAGGQPQATTTPNRLSRAASNSNLLGTVTSPIGGVPNTRGGRLGRLQYSKGGGISPAAPSPSWEAARGSIRDSTSGAGASSLGRASTPNLAAAFARAETAQSSATSQATAGLNQPSPTAGTASAFSRSGDSGRPSPVRTTVPANSLWATSSGDGAATVGGSAHSSSSSQGPGWDSGSSLTGLGIDGGSSNGGSATGTAVTSPGGSGPRELLLPALTKADPGGPASFNSRRTSSSAAELLNSGFAGGLHARTSSPGLSPLTTSDERFNSPTIGAGPAGSAFDATPRTSVHEMYGTGRYATPSARESSLMRAQSGSSPHSESGYSPYMQSQAQFAQASALSSGLPSGQGSLPNSPRIGDPSSPAIGGLSDSAIAALGAMPGTGPDALLNPSGAPLSSKNVLTIALQKAQSAVLLDSANNVPEAIAAYRQAVRLLQEVMERIAPKNGRKARTSREEERRRLRVIVSVVGMLC